MHSPLKAGFHMIANHHRDIVESESSHCSEHMETWTYKWLLVTDDRWTPGRWKLYTTRDRTIVGGLLAITSNMETEL